ncbi:MAG: hypothetical protein KBG15_09480 [Kofleriaceae bacterium]|nr:hypothetical protein [Kofleriaceae bacterium]
MWKISERLETIVWAVAQPTLRSYCESTSALVAAVEDRSRRYTSEREALDRPSNAQGDLAARALFFTVADASKIQLPLAELIAAQRLDGTAAAPLRVLDIGAGCGAMSLGLLDAWVRCGYSRALHFTLIERDAAAVALASATLLQAGQVMGVAVTVATVRSDLTAGTWMRGLLPFDLIVAGTVLNELAEVQQLSLVSAAMQLVTVAGHLIIIEPALRETSRALHRLRDALLGRGAVRVLAPCVRAGAPCPALAQDSDWCHEERLSALPARAAEIARLTHLRDSGLKFAYLTLVRSDAAVSPAAIAGEKFRIVRQPRGLKGREELLGCGEAGWVPIRLLRRHRSQGNQLVQDTHRGDVLVLHRALPVAVEAAPDAMLDIRTDDRVELVAAALPSTSEQP